MKTIKEVYETGATSHAINDLILFTDNTRKLVEYRDNYYKRIKNFQRDFGYVNMSLFRSLFSEMFCRSQNYYLGEFGRKDSKHILNIDDAGQKEFIDLYVADYDSWVNDHS